MVYDKCGNNILTSFYITSNQKYEPETQYTVFYYKKPVYKKPEALSGRVYPKRNLLKEDILINKQFLVN